jgi:hypothetical protein
MDWKKFIILFLRNVIIATALTGAIFGAIGFLLAGKEGFVNLATWGLLLGLIGGFSGGLAMLVSAKYWGDYAGRYGAWWIKNETEGEPEQSKESEKKAKRA